MGTKMINVQLTSYEVDLLKRLMRAATQQMDQTDPAVVKKSDFSWIDTGKYTHQAAANFKDRNLIRALRRKLT